MFAIISDIHSNLEALNAVLEDIESRQISEIVCLCDIVGYGPDPEPCMDLVMHTCRFSISGNHDYAVLTEPEGFVPIARKAVEYTRRIMTENIPNSPKKQERWEYLRSMLLKKEENSYYFVHGSPRAPRYEYILPTDVAYGLKDKIQDVFTYFQGICFVGHSHMPGIFTEDFRFFTPSEINYEYVHHKGKLLVNVGSVGQPRDNDRRACYVIVDGNRILFRRPRYDFHTTIDKIRKIDELDNFSGERLAMGR